MLSSPITSRIGSAPTMMARPADAKAELEALAEAQQIPMGFWDPKLANTSSTKRL